MGRRFPMNFSEYYKYYLSLHKNRKSRRLHVVGNLITLAFIVYCLVSRNWLYLLAAPFIVYPFAWIGHLIFEKNKPLSWRGFGDYGLTTLKAKICDWIMIRDILLGRIKW